MIMEGKEVPIFGDGSLERDYTYIDDIVDGILRALDAPGQFDVYNIGNSHPIRIDEMVDTLGRALQKPVRRKFIPTPAGEMLLTHADLTKARAGTWLLAQSQLPRRHSPIRRVAEVPRLARIVAAACIPTPSDSSTHHGQTFLVYSHDGDFSPEYRYAKSFCAGINAKK